MVHQVTTAVSYGVRQACFGSGPTEGDCGYTMVAWALGPLRREVSGRQEEVNAQGKLVFQSQASLPAGTPSRVKLPMASSRELVMTRLRAQNFQKQD